MYNMEMAQKISQLVLYIVAVALLFELAAVVPVHSSDGSNNFMQPATKEAFKKLWKGFRAVDYTVVSASEVHGYLM